MNAYVPSVIQLIHLWVIIEWKNKNEPLWSGAFHLVALSSVIMMYAQPRRETNNSTTLIIIVDSLFVSTQPRCDELSENLLRAPIAKCRIINVTLTHKSSIWMSASSMFQMLVLEVSPKIKRISATTMYSTSNHITFFKISWPGWKKCNYCFWTCQK